MSIVTQTNIVCTRPPETFATEDYVYSQADLRRGFADWVVPDGATHLTPRILYCHGGGYEWYSPQACSCVCVCTLRGYTLSSAVEV